jgi:hypothetical protein
MCDAYRIVEPRVCHVPRQAEGGLINDEPAPPEAVGWLIQRPGPSHLGFTLQPTQEVLADHHIEGHGHLWGSRGVGREGNVSVKEE